VHHKKHAAGHGAVHHHDHHAADKKWFHLQHILKESWNLNDSLFWLWKIALL
jgi:hypothetical protein